MTSRQFTVRTVLLASVAGVALLGNAPAMAQEVAADSDEDTIVVTGSRIVRDGFEMPTPTTVVGETEIRQASRINLQQTLNDLPQVRNTISPSQSIANTSSGVAPVDLRGLGTSRTLTLVNGRRFVGDNNLNFVPTSLVDRVELVTGGASAAWGSGAVAGVVNIILNDDLEGVTLGVQGGVSSRGDGERHGYDASFGTRFADGAGHFMFGIEYVNDKGIGNEGREDRPWLGAGLVDIGGGQLELQPDVNDLTALGSPITFGGTVLTGSLAGQVFNPDGSLRPATSDDYFGFYDTLIVGSPLERIGSYGRVSFDVSDNITLWADAVYGRSDVNQPFLPDPANPILAFGVAANNPFLSPQIQQQLATAGEPAIFLGRLSRDTFMLQFDALRETTEFAAGIEGTFGDGWMFDAHYSHGEVDSSQRFYNSSIPTNFLNAVNAVQVGGDIVCAINADADPSNDDPACAPFNPFGENAASAEAQAYVAGTQMSDTVNTLDSAAVRVQGDPFSLPAGPVSVAFGVEARWEDQEEEIGAQDIAGVFGTPIFNNALEGGFDVQEGFAEALVPVLDSDGLEIDLNGAARYSNYSLSGGIWSWKLGGTMRIQDDLLLRATRSRDIRAPSISNLFAVNSINIRPVVDNDSAGRDSDPGYDPNPRVTIFSGGNTDLVPEVSETWTVGGSYSPSFVSGLDISVDYYSIKIGNAIVTPSTADITAACAAGDADACSRVLRDSTGTITTVYGIAQNIAQYETSGVDIEASYRVPMSDFADLPGMLNFRVLATYVDDLIFDTGANSRNTVGDVGDPVLDGVPEWRMNFSASYETDTLGFDLRTRYVGGGQFNDELNIVNGDIDARTYVDLGARVRVMDRVTFFGNVNNVFDKEPPLVTTTTNAHYDGVGRYYSFGARVEF